MAEEYIEELKLTFGSQYQTILNKTYCRTNRQGKRRNSGKHYENSAEKIAAIKEKYKKGVSLDDINRMLEVAL